MRTLFATLLTGLGRDLVIGRIEAIKKTAVAAAIAYFLIAIFAVASLCYLYAALWFLLARANGPLAASWIMLGGNLALMLVVYLGYRIYRSTINRSSGVRAQSTRTDMLSGGVPLSLAYEAGRAVEGGFRKHARSIAVTAVVLGLAIGARPELLGLGRKRRK